MCWSDPEVAEALEHIVAEVIIAVFDAANPVVGEGVFGARSDGPAGRFWSASKLKLLPKS